MTQYPELMEILEEHSTNLLYNKISAYIRGRERETNFELNEIIKFIEGPLFLLTTTELPISDEQGAYEYIDLAVFVSKFRQMMKDYIKSKIQKQNPHWAKITENVWRFPEERKKTSE